MTAPGPPPATGRHAGRGLVGYAPGVFDMLHIGHVNLVRRARLQCDHLIAGVTTDDEALRNKGRRPVVPEDERLALVAALRQVDLAVLEWTPDKARIWESLRFDVFFKGDDWRGTERGRAWEEQLSPLGVSVVYLPYTAQISTSKLRRVTRGPGTTSAPPAGPLA